MATIVRTETPKRWQPWTLPWLGRQLLLVPETLLLPLIFGAYILFDRPLALAMVGEFVIAFFMLRTILLWAAGQAFENGRYRRASRLIRWALRLHPWSADSIALSGAIQFAQGQSAEALQLLNRAVELFPGHATLYLRLSAVLAAEGDLAEARVAALQAKALDENNPLVYSQLAELTIRASGNGFTAQDLVRQGLVAASNPQTQAALYTVLAEATMMVGDLKAAQIAVQEAELLLLLCPVPLQAELLYRLGNVRRYLGDRDRARSDFQLVQEIDPAGRFVAPAWRARVETKAA